MNNIGLTLYAGSFLLFFCLIYLMFAGYFIPDLPWWYAKG